MGRYKWEIYGRYQQQGVNTDRPSPATSDKWVERLAQALSNLAAAQEIYRDELYQRRQERVRSRREIAWSVAPEHPSDDLSAFYYQACLREGRYFEERYAPLRTSFARVHTILAGHPAWAALLDPSDTGSEFWTQMANGGGRGTLLTVIAGLMARAIEVREDGFRVASTELNALLAADANTKLLSSPGDLSVGYHAALVHGLRVSDDLRIADDMTLVPFERMRAYVNESVLSDVAPHIVKYNAWESVGAIVKPFRWSPAFSERGEDSEPELDWGGSFFEDAEAFVQLLAMLHAAPVISLVTIPYCIHHTASYLMGRPHYHGGYGWGPMARSFGRFGRADDVSQRALDEARNAFAGRNSDSYRTCAPAISRLAEALARSGRFEADDKILDTALALERMYGTDGAEITFKLKTMAACFLETCPAERLQVFRDMGKFYKVRSDIVHARQRQPTHKQKAEAFEKGLEIARRTVVKLLRDGPPPDWNEMVVTETPRQPGKAAKTAPTTQPGYRNRNDQVVVRRTPLPGTDHNQRIYVLECGRCRHRYGANGSDIWQRRCPSCGGGRPGLNFD